MYINVDTHTHTHTYIYIYIYIYKSEDLISGGAPPKKKNRTRIKISGTALMENHPWLAGALWALLKTIAVY